MRKVGVLGSLVWDEIHGRDPVAPPVEEWGGIAYALAGLDAALDDDWQIVPLIKVGDDLAADADRLFSRLRHVATGVGPISVPVPNNRVTLRYRDGERRSERMSGGVPPWTWAELGPMVTDLDAIYVNFISGFEMGLGTAELLRKGFSGPIYADLHSLFLAIGADGVRMIQALPHPTGWFSQFDIVQCNEEEMHQLGPDPMAITAAVLGAGVSLLNVTLGRSGVAYVARPGFDSLADLRRPATDSAAVRTERIGTSASDAIDPTGCGDVFGSTCFARLLAGDSITEALSAANGAAARNAAFRGATDLARHLRGELVGH